MFQCGYMYLLFCVFILFVYFRFFILFYCTFSKHLPFNCGSFFFFLNPNDPTLLFTATTLASKSLSFIISFFLLLPSTETKCRKKKMKDLETIFYDIAYEYISSFTNSCLMISSYFFKEVRVKSYVKRTSI